MGRAQCLIASLLGGERVGVGEERWEGTTWRMRALTSRAVWRKCTFSSINPCTSKRRPRPPAGMVAACVVTAEPLYPSGFSCGHQKEEVDNDGV